MIFYSRNYGTSRFTRVFAVAVAAVFGKPENIRKEMPHLFRREINSAESPDTGNVDNRPSTGKVDHFGECGGVGSGVMYVGNRTGSEVSVRDERIDNR